MIGNKMLIAIDSNIFISALGKKQHDHDLASRLMLDIRDDKHNAITSSITYGEVLGVNNINKDELKLSSLFNAIKNITTIAADDEICKVAAGYRVSKNLKLPDAIHAATAYLYNADLLISNDLELIKKMKNKIQCLTLKQWINQ